MIHCVGEPEKNPSHGNLEVPSFIKEVLPLWKLGDFLPEQIRNKMFTSDPSTLYILKRDLMQILTPVKLRKDIKEMEEGDVQYLESMLGRGDNEEADIESEIKIPDFTDYVSPNKPRGQRELLNDYLYIWTTHKRLRGKGQLKSNSTITQYAGLLFVVSNSLYKHLSRSNIEMENLLFPMGKTSTAVTAWANTGNAPTICKIYWFSNCNIN